MHRTNYDQLELLMINASRKCSLASRTSHDAQL